MIEKRLRDCDPTLTKRATLQLEMLDALARKDMPAEETLTETQPLSRRRLRATEDEEQ